MGSTDLAAIESTIQTYLDGLYEGDTQKLGAAFHECCHLYWLDESGAVKDLPRDEWFKIVDGRPQPKPQGRARAPTASSASTRAARRRPSSRSAGRFRRASSPTISASSSRVTVAGRSFPRPIASTCADPGCKLAAAPGGGRS